MQIDKNKLKEIKQILFIEAIEQKKYLQPKLLYFTIINAELTILAKTFRLLMCSLIS
jgi:hypothetical protein